MAKVRIRARSRQVAERPLISKSELAQLGEGYVGYVRRLSSRQVRKEFPDVRNVPRDAMLYVLHGADGTPIAIRDTLRGVESRARSGKLEIASLH